MSPHRQRYCTQHNATLQTSLHMRTAPDRRHSERSPPAWSCSLLEARPLWRHHLHYHGRAAPQLGFLLLIWISAPEQNGKPKAKNPLRGTFWGAFPHLETSPTAQRAQVHEVVEKSASSREVPQSGSCKSFDWELCSLPPANMRWMDKLLNLWMKLFEYGGHQKK